MGAYRCADNPTGVWTTTDPLFDSLEYLEDKDNVGGCVFFRYGSIPAVSGMADRLTQWYQTVHNENTTPSPSKPNGSGSSSLDGQSFSSILSQFLLSMIQ